MRKIFLGLLFLILFINVSTAQYVQLGKSLWKDSSGYFLLYNELLGTTLNGWIQPRYFSTNIIGPGISLTNNNQITVNLDTNSGLILNNGKLKYTGSGSVLTDDSTVYTDIYGQLRVRIPVDKGIKKTDGGLAINVSTNSGITFDAGDGYKMKINTDNTGLQVTGNQVGLSNSIKIGNTIIADSSGRGYSDSLYTRWMQFPSQSQGGLMWGTNTSYLARIWRTKTITDLFSHFEDYYGWKFDLLDGTNIMQMNKGYLSFQFATSVHGRINIIDTLDVTGAVKIGFPSSGSSNLYGYPYKDSVNNFTQHNRFKIMTLWTSSTDSTQFLTNGGGNLVITPTGTDATFGTTSGTGTKKVYAGDYYRGTTQLTTYLNTNTTLSNVPYLDKVNIFSVNQTVTDTMKAYNFKGVTGQSSVKIMGPGSGLNFIELYNPLNFNEMDFNSNNVLVCYITPTMLAMNTAGAPSLFRDKSTGYTFGGNTGLNFHQTSTDVGEFDANSSMIFQYSTTAVTDYKKHIFTGSSWTTATVNTDITITAETFYTDVDASGANRTITLTASPTNGETHYITKTDATANTVTIGGNGHNINGASTKVISTQYVSYEVSYNSTDGAWYLR